MRTGKAYLVKLMIDYFDTDRNQLISQQEFIDAENRSDRANA